MKLLSIFYTISILFCSIYGSERPDAWQTRGGDIPGNSIVWNYMYGQSETGRNDRDICIFGKQPEGNQPYGVASPTKKSESAPASPKSQKLSPAEQARATAETLIIALSHAQNAHDFEEIGTQFQDTLNALPEAAQIELITRFGDTQHNREHALRAEAIQLERTKQEHERAERARASIRVSPKTITKPAQLPLAVIQAEQLASKAASMDKVAVDRAIKDLARFIDEGHLSKEHQEKIDAALARLYTRREELGG